MTTITINTTPDGLTVSIDGSEEKSFPSIDEALDEVATVLSSEEEGPPPEGEQPEGEEDSAEGGPREGLPPDEGPDAVPGEEALDAGEKAFLEAYDSGRSPRPVAGA